MVPPCRMFYHEDDQQVFVLFVMREVRQLRMVMLENSKQPASFDAFSPCDADKFTLILGPLDIQDETMDIIDIKAFIPSEDYEVSKSFYSEIGFEPEYVSEDLTLFQNGDCLFFLQRFFNAELATNFMLQICVSDIESAYSLCSQSKHKTKITPIQHESWGKVFYLWGPVGELLHITELAG